MTAGVVSQLRASTERSAPGVVRVPVGPVEQAVSRGSGINSLTSSGLTDMGGGPTFYSCLVQVERCGD